MNGILYYSKKKKNVQIFNAKYYCSLLCLSKNEKISRLGGEKVMNLLRRDYDKICVTVLMNYNPCNIISLPL